jgi:mRNA-degrading endonuclease HigB of HigAB toxin-antitoxin module
MKKEFQCFELSDRQLDQFVKGIFEENRPRPDMVKSEFLTVEQIKDKIWNDKWMVFHLGIHPLDVIPYLKSGFKIIFMKGSEYRRFKKEYTSLM